MSEENRSQEEDQVAARVQEVAERIRRIREPFRRRRRSIVNSLLGSLEKRAYERGRAYRYNPSSQPEEDEVAKLRKEIEELKKQLEHRPPKPTVAIRSE